MPIERIRKLACKPLLRDRVPVDFFHGAAGHAKTWNRASWTIRPLLARCRIVLFEEPLDDEIDVERVASVAQEESLLTVANEDKTVMWNAIGRAGSKFRRHVWMLQYAASIDANISVRDMTPLPMQRENPRGVASCLMRRRLPFAGNR